MFIHTSLNTTWGGRRSLGRCYAFDSKKHTRLNLDLEDSWFAILQGKFSLMIKPDKLENHIMVSILKQLSNAKHPAFCARGPEGRSRTRPQKLI